MTERKTLTMADGKVAVLYQRPYSQEYTHVSNCKCWICIYYQWQHQRDIEQLKQREYNQPMPCPDSDVSFFK